MTRAKQKLKTRRVVVRNGFRVKGDPVDIYNALETIRKQTGTNSLGAEDILNAAANPSNPLHEEFEWDDSIAAREHRLGQARYLIRSIEVTYEITPPGKAKEVRIVTTSAYSNPRKRGPSGGEDYLLTVDVVDDKDRREELLEEALRDIERFKQKYNILTELSELMDNINAALKALRRTKK